MKEVERPAPVLVTARDHDFDSFTDAAIRLDTRVPQIIESPQDVVIPEGGEREPEPAFVDRFPGSTRAEHASLEQIIFGFPARSYDSRRFASGTFVFEQSFEDADGGVEGRAPAFGRFAVPAAVFELLGQEPVGQGVVRFFEIRSDSEDSAVDAGLCFAVEERPVVERLEHDAPLDAVDHLASRLARGVETEILQNDQSVKSNEHASVLFPQIRAEVSRGIAPVAGRGLDGEKLGAPAFRCNARPFGCDCGGGFSGKVPHDLPANGRVGIEEPPEVRGPGRVVEQAHWTVVTSVAARGRLVVDSPAMAVPNAIALTFVAAIAWGQSLSLSPKSLKLHNVKVEQATYKGREAIRVTDAMKPGEEGRDDRIAILAKTALRNGTIEAQIAGEPGPGAFEGARGFVGLAFRIAPDGSKFECFYLRPTNGRADDQVRRNHSVQYISSPEFPWSRLRKEFPEKYESYADLVPGQWTKVRVEVNGDKARLFVNGAGQPSLVVNDLKLAGNAAGAIGLWIGPGTVAHFASLTVASR
jgi:hypothetical protein